MRHMRGVRPIVVGLLFFGLSAFAETPADNELSKPAPIQDGQSAQAYISSALYEYLDSPPYLVIHSATPFFENRLGGQSLWLPLIAFYSWVTDENNVPC